MAPSGEEFGQYRLERLIGRGAVGEVWEATDRIARRTVAIKRLAPHLAEDSEVRRRFEREARLASRLRDPHVVPIHRYGEIDGRLYVDMQLVEGLNLQEVLVRQGPMQPRRAAAVVGQVAHALTTAHKSGLVHRDVKPSNILMTVGHDGQDLAYLADFGITRNLEAGPDSRSSGALVVGTFDYMAPEQFQGDATPSSDVYSLACVLFQCLTGSVPYPSGGLPAVMHAHLSAEPPRVSQRAPWVGTALDGVLARALAKDPRARQESAMALAVETRTAVGGGRDAGGRPDPTSSPGPSGPPWSRPAGPPTGAGLPVGAWSEGTTVTRRRRTVLAGAAIATAVVLLGAVAVAGVTLSRESSADTPTAPQAAPAVPPGPEAAPRVPEVAASLAEPANLGIVNMPGRPETVAVSRDGTRSFSTTSTGPPALRIVDTASRQEIRSEPVPGVPRFVVTAPDGTVYVTFNDEVRDQLSVAQVDPATGGITKLIPTGQPADRKYGQTWLFVSAVSADGRRLYVPHHTGSVVSVLDTDSGLPVAQIPMPRHPHAVALAPDGRTAYVAAHASGEVEVLDTVTNTVTGTIPIGPGTAPHDLAVSPDGAWLHVANYDAGTMSYVETATGRVAGAVAVGRHPQSVVFAPDGRHSYVVDNDGNTVSVVDTATHRVVGAPRVSIGASMVALSRDGRRAYVASRDTGVVTTLRTAD